MRKGRVDSRPPLVHPHPSPPPFEGEGAGKSVSVLAEPSTYCGNWILPSLIICKVSANNRCSCFSTRSARVSAVSFSRTGTWHWLMIGPVS